MAERIVSADGDDGKRRPYVRGEGRNRGIGATVMTDLDNVGMQIVTRLQETSPHFKSYRANPDMVQLADWLDVIP
jgi:hypothetical protein